MCVGEDSYFSKGGFAVAWKYMAFEALFPFNVAFDVQS